MYIKNIIFYQVGPPMNVKTVGRPKDKRIIGAIENKIINKKN